MRSKVVDASVGPGASFVTEMAIVDTFTKLIFDQQEQLGSVEHRIIDGMRALDSSFADGSCHELGQYLRTMGVREMTSLVSRLHNHLIEGIPTVALDDEAVRAISLRRCH